MGLIQYLLKMHLAVFITLA